MKSWRISKTINWGHVQMAAGVLATIIPLITPKAFPDVPLWAFGPLSMLAAGITYWLRAQTTETLRRGPPREKDY